MANIIAINAATRRPFQAKAPQAFDLPTIPMREAIVDQWLDEMPVNLIAARLRIDGATVQAVIRGWCEIWHRQAVTSRMEAPQWLRERHRQIEDEVWAETANRKRVA